MRKTIIQLLLTCMCLIPVYAWSQHIEIRGKIFDNETLEAIPFCTISVKGAQIGTCSNSQGEFIFHCPDSLKAYDLMFRSIGYKTKPIQLKLLADKEIMTIYLEPELYEIPEINVSSNQLSATDIIRHVIRKMRKNYPRNSYYMEGFLRDRCFNLIDNTNTRLTEAAVEIVKKEFGNTNNADKVKVTEIRNSFNYSKLGSWRKEKRTQAFWGYSTDNSLYKTLQYMDFTNSRILTNLLGNDFFSKTISGYSMFDGKPVVIVDIKEEIVGSMTRNAKAVYAYDLCRLFIDVETYTMLKTEFYWIDKHPKEMFSKNFKIYLKQDSIVSYAIKQYENIDGQYYLKYADYLGRVHDQPDTGEFKKMLYFNETELLINKVITNKKEFDQIKHKDLLKRNAPLWEMKYVYNPSFWENYNILIDKPLNPGVQKDLEKDVPLNNQFKDAGVKNSKDRK